MYLDKKLTTCIGAVLSAILALYTWLKEIFIKPINTIGYCIIELVSNPIFILVADLLIILLLAFSLAYYYTRIKTRKQNMAFTKVAYIIIITGLIYLWHYYYFLWNEVVLFLTIIFWIPYLVEQVKKPVKNVLITMYVTIVFLIISIISTYQRVFYSMVEYHDIVLFLIYIPFSTTTLTKKLQDIYPEKFCKILTVCLYVCLLRTLRIQIIVFSIISIISYVVKLIKCFKQLRESP